MIDTIKFRIWIDRDLYKTIRSKSIELSQKDNEIDREFVRILTKKFNVGSFDRHINIKLYDEEYIFMEFSIPKIYYGHNVFLIAPEKVIGICNEVRTVLFKMFGSFPDCCTWEISRIDFCYAWKLPSEYIAEQIVNILRNIEIKRKKMHYYDTSVMWYGRTQAIKFYLKYPEFYEHDFKELKKQGFNELAYNFLQISEGVLRFEVTLRNIALVREFYGSSADRYVALEPSIFNSARCLLILQKYLHKILKLENVSVMDNKTVYDKLVKELGIEKARRLFLFYKLLFTPDRNEKDILKSYSRWQVYRNLKELKACGIGISSDQLQIGFDFSIPSDFVVNNT
jgi:II/X family phage/plasmid replication protein